MVDKLSDFAKQNGIKYFLISFTDLFGVQRAKLVPASAIDDMVKNGAGFAGFAAYLDMTPEFPDLMAMPDISKVIQLPWNKEVAWVPADCSMNNQPVGHSPRSVLRRSISKAEKQGLFFKSGVEAEFFLLSSENHEISDLSDFAAKPCYDQQALMRRYDVISEICDYMSELGWAPYQNDHEDANGQFEMNWAFDDVLNTADKHAFFKFMVKSVAEKNDFKATFMPKPFHNSTGNGCHIHVSAWTASGNANLFLDLNNEYGISSRGSEFLAGLIQHANALCAITNPTVNSYKRLNASTTISGATWAPNTATWAGNNRTHMIRIPGPGRLELRLPDGAVNPYLLQAVVLEAGLLGIENKLDAGKPNHGATDGVDLIKVTPPYLPLNLLDALREFKNDVAMSEAFGDEFSKAYLKLKSAEWADYSAHLSCWETRNTLDI